MKYILTTAILLSIIASTNSYAQQEVNPAWEETIRERLNHILEEKYHSHRRDEGGALEKGAAAQAQIGVETLVSGVERKESEIHAAINPTDTANIVIAPIQEVVAGGSMGGGELALPLYITTDFGATWTKSSFEPGGGGGGDPVLAFDADGTLYFSWLKLDFQGFELSIAMNFASSTDGGFTWGPVGTIDQGSMNFQSGKMVDKQWMACDHSNSPRRNTLYTAYVLMELAGMSQQFAIAVKRKLPGNAAFESQIATITDASFSQVQFPSVNVDADGRVHVFWWGVRNGVSGLWHSMSTDGSTYGAIHKIADTRFPEQGQQSTVPSHLPQRLGVMPQFDVDANADSEFKNNLYATWNANPPSPSAGTYSDPFNVYFAYSSDLGATWSAPQRVADAPDTTANQFHPSISVSPSGAVIVTWYDGRDHAQNEQMHYYTAVSFNGGTSFSPNVRVSEASSNMHSDVQGSFGIGDYDRALSTAHYAIPIWSDGRGNDGDLNVYAAFVPLESIIPVELSAFTAHVSGNIVTLRWTTETETNNAGFEVQPSPDGEAFSTAAFIKGRGTTVLRNDYSYQDEIDDVTFYRLKQIDFDGSFEFSPTVRSVPALPSDASLEQNYPNPFSASTSVTFTLDRDAEITLTIHDALGRKVRTLASERVERGKHTYTWDGTSDEGKTLPPGMYMYTLRTGTGTPLTGKMTFE
ncbi:MAG: hypothetical protein CL946_10090 [Ectothiorhodospiraceae bacterium]|nr:hypothetical protein [Ectothiorhodospiraceae bacterium]